MVSRRTPSETFHPSHLLLSPVNSIQAEVDFGTPRPESDSDNEDTEQGLQVRRPFGTMPRIQSDELENGSQRHDHLPFVPTTLSQSEAMGPRLQQLPFSPSQAASRQYEISPRVPQLLSGSISDQMPIRVSSLRQLALQLNSTENQVVVINGVSYKLDIDNSSNSRELQDGTNTPQQRDSTNLQFPFPEDDDHDDPQLEEDGPRPEGEEEEAKSDRVLTSSFIENVSYMSVNSVNVSMVSDDKGSEERKKIMVDVLEVNHEEEQKQGLAPLGSILVHQNQPQRKNSFNKKPAPSTLLFDKKKTPKKQKTVRFFDDPPFSGSPEEPKTRQENNSFKSDTQSDEENTIQNVEVRNIDEEEEAKFEPFLPQKFSTDNSNQTASGVVTPTVEANESPSAPVIEETKMVSPEPEHPIVQPQETSPQKATTQVKKKSFRPTVQVSWPPKTAAPQEEEKKAVTTSKPAVGKKKIQIKVRWPPKAQGETEETKEQKVSPVEGKKRKKIQVNVEWKKDSTTEDTLDDTLKPPPFKTPNMTKTVSSAPDYSIHQPLELGEMSNQKRRQTTAVTTAIARAQIDQRLNKKKLQQGRLNVHAMLAYKLKVQFQKNIYKNIDLDDIIANRFQQQLKRSDSEDDCMSMYTRNRKQLYRENQELRERLQMRKVDDAARMHIGFLHASPLIYQNREARQKIPQLNFTQEERVIKNAIKRSGQEVNYVRTVATKENFVKVLRHQPFILHISCHGYDASSSSQQQFGTRKQDATNFLLFEDDLGQGEPIDQKQIQDYLTPNMGKIEVIFVAACMSRFVEPIFRKCGANHVICVEKSKSILDAAAIQFTNSFYTGVVNGKTICQAFANAQEDVRFQFSLQEAKKFQLHTKDDNIAVEHSKQNCQSRWPSKAGNFVCHSDHIKVKSLPSKVENFLERELEMSNLVRHLLENDKIVDFMGLPGIGKSLLARNALCYLSERKFFSKGIVTLPLVSVSSVIVLIGILKSLLVDKLKTDTEEGQKLHHKIRNIEETKQFIIKFFNEDYQGATLRKEKNQLQAGRFLLVMDNATSIIQEDKQKFQEFLQLLLDNCSKLKIMVTSRTGLDMNFTSVQATPFILPGLSKKNSVRLFLNAIDNSQHEGIQMEEIVDLITSEQSYPLKEVMSEYKPSMMKMEVFNLATKFFKDRSIHDEIVIDALAKSKLFDFLGGNPLVISMVANCYITPLNTQKSLTNLWEFVQHEMNEKGTYPQNMKNVNNISLENSISLTISMLNIESITLLNYFTFMPGGATIHQLSKLLNMAVDDQLDKLNQLGLLNLDDHTGRYVLKNNSLRDYIQRVLTRESFEKTIGELIRYYLEEMMLLYKNMYTDIKLDLLCDDSDAEFLKNHPLMKNQKRFGSELSLTRKVSKTLLRQDSESSPGIFSDQKRLLKLYSKSTMTSRRNADFINISFAVSQISKMQREVSEENSAMSSADDMQFKRAKSVMTDPNFDNMSRLQVNNQPQVPSNFSKAASQTMRKDQILSSGHSFLLSQNSAKNLIKNKKEEEEETPDFNSQLQKILGGANQRKYTNTITELQSKHFQKIYENPILDFGGECVSDMFSDISTFPRSQHKRVFSINDLKMLQQRDSPLNIEELKDEDNEESPSQAEFSLDLLPTSGSKKHKVKSVVIDEVSSQQSQQHTLINLFTQRIQKQFQSMENMMKECKEAAEDFSRAANFSLQFAHNSRSSIKQINLAMCHEDSQSSDSDKDSSVENQDQNEEKQLKMTKEQEFIIMFQVVQVLASDLHSEEIPFEEIQKFLTIDKSPFFFGNFYRLQALLDEQDNVGQDTECTVLLKEAIKKAEKSLQAYELVQDGDYKRSALYGQAISKFLLGYLHQKLAERQEAGKGHNAGDFDDDDPLNQARLQLYASAKLFKEVGHLKGCELAFRSLITLYKSDEQEYIEDFEAQAQEYAQKYEKYIRDNGHRCCSYIPRKKMEVLSLMTEIVHYDDVTPFRMLKQKTFRHRKSNFDGLDPKLLIQNRKQTTASIKKL